MIIETKFNIGQEVWCLFDHSVAQGEISEISIDVDDDGKYIDMSYFIKSAMVNGWICEKYIFRTKQELLDSL